MYITLRLLNKLCSRDTGLKRPSSGSIISNDLTEKLMVFDSFIIHYLIIITRDSLENSFTTSLPKRIKIASY